VQTGNDLVLDANGADCSEDNVFIYWKFKEKINLVRLTCHKGREPTVNKLKYQDRTEITEKTSLKLKNCLRSFSGVYSAERMSGEDEVVFVGLCWTVISSSDPVSPAHLKVDSVLNSSDVCNLTVTCSTDHSSQTNTSQQGNLLHVYLSDESVICNHSNQVSWANSTKKIKHFCPLNYGNWLCLPTINNLFFYRRVSNRTVVECLIKIMFRLNASVQSMCSEMWRDIFITSVTSLTGFEEQFHE
uniref:Uncharacterized protein n=1 Tax=Oryzias sinensis TaxID=183150 RepID=A0A8C7ZQ98_9TELE